MQATEKQLDGAIRTCEDALSHNNEAENEELSMPLSSLSGTFFFALFVQAIALLLGLFEFLTKRTIQDWLVRN